MASVSVTRACTACASAKRRCGKQTPRCLRCQRRGIVDCTYPPVKPTSFVLCGDRPVPFDHVILPDSGIPQSSTYSMDPGVRGQNYAGISLSLLDLPDFSSSNLVDKQPLSSWFAGIETWKIVPFTPGAQDTTSRTDLKRHIISIYRCLIQCVEKASNPFIHSQLYRRRFPRCVQDAYTTLSCYLRKTAPNEQTILRIVEDRVKQLLLENGIVDSLAEGMSSTNSATLDSLEHIARVHALLVYQAICLHDGDIRLRHLGESHIPVLYSWTLQMVEHASQVVCLGTSIISSPHEQTTTSSDLFDVENSDNLLWYSWILAESIRRTWMVGCAIQGLFSDTQHGRPTGCGGGMMLTTRRGVWDAQTALAWEKLCLEWNIGLMQVTETDKLFTEVTPEDVDDFAKAVLEIAFGVERMERWESQLKQYPEGCTVSPHYVDTSNSRCSQST